jgi:hypothetical protein
MSIRDYPGFKYVPLHFSSGEVRDTWNAKFCRGYIVSVEGKFYTTHSNKYNKVCDDIYEAMSYIRNKAIINFFDK